MKTSRVIVGILVAPLVAPLVFYLISMFVTAMTPGEGDPIRFRSLIYMVRQSRTLLQLF
jgi:hypothetical protein